MLLDNVLDLLSNEYRRNIMYFMKDSKDDIFSYDEIVEGLVEENYVDDVEADRFKVQMGHVHLAKMEESGLVEKDKRSETVRYFPREKVENLLEDIEKYDESSEF